MYFFDSHALIELLKGTGSFRRYFDEPVITSSLSLGEAYYYFLKTGFGAQFLQLIAGHKIECVSVEKQDVLRAVRFRQANWKKKLSLSDRAGYTISTTRGLTYLTSNRKFDGIPNTEIIQ